jgi:GDPmannose 4,6-dehydratase
MNKKIVITGVSGQVGSYMSEYCLKLGHDVYGIVRRTSTPNIINYKHLIGNPKFNIVHADLTDGSSIESAVGKIKPDYFINLAAQSFVGVSWSIPEETFNVDTLGVIRCLESVRKSVPKCRFYNAGSSEQFGDVDYIPQDETHPFKPRSPYGAAKCAAHHIIKVYRESYGIYAVQGLLFNHESERRGEEFVTRKITKGVARILKELESDKITAIELGNIDSKRDWSHAEDFVDGIWKMLNQDSPRDFVLSSGETHSIREFVQLAFKFAGIKGEWIKSNDNAESEVFVFDNKVLVKINPKFYRPAEVDILLGSSECIRRELGWKPSVSFEGLVERMVQNDLIIVG